jgi:tyrosine-protein kinase Etk/Wzc
MSKEYEPTLQDYLKVIRKKKWLIVASCLICICLGMYYCKLKVDVYKASTTIKIEKDVTAGLGILSGLNPDIGVDTELKTITSYKLIKLVAQRLKLINEYSNPEIIKKVVYELRGKISATQQGNTNIITITVKSIDRYETARVANMVAKVYAEENPRQKDKEILRMRKFVEKQLKKYESELSETQQRLQQFIEKEGIIGSIKRDPIVKHLQDKLVKLKLQLFTLSEKYTKKHPAVIEVKENIAKIQAKLTSRLKNLSQKETEFNKLSTEVKLIQETYLMFKKKMAEIKLREAGMVEKVTVMEPAAVPTTPIGPSKKAILIIAGVLGIVLGVIFAFITEALDTSFRTIEEIEAETNLSVLSVIPHIPNGKWFTKKVHGKKFAGHIKALAAYYSPESSVAEAYRTLRTNVQFLGLKRLGNALLVTSTSPQEGKSTTTFNLAITLAETGLKTVLVGTNLRRPTLHEVFGVPKEPGLTDILIEKRPWQEVIRSANDMQLPPVDTPTAPGIENLYIITSGYISLNPAELLNSEEMTNLIQDLKRKFDVVLFDAPPSLAVTDSIVLGSKVDEVVLVYRVGKTSKQALHRAKALLDNVNAKVLGIILNDVRKEVEVGIFPYYRYYGSLAGKKAA